MEKTSVKTVIIIILILLNLLLLANLLLNDAYSESVDPAALEDLSDILGRRGIEVAEAAFPQKVVRSLPLAVRRSEELEAQAAARFLGACDAEQLGGGLVSYSSPAGSATFRQNFGFEINLENSPFFGANADDTARRVREALAEAGFSVESLEMTAVSDGYGFEAVQKIAGLPVENLVLSGEVGLDGRFALSGRWVFTYGSSVDGGRSMPAHSLALPFAEAAVERGYPLGIIEGVSYCYYLNQLSSGEFEIIPACTFVTDAGIFRVDARKFAFVEFPAAEE